MNIKKLITSTDNRQPANVGLIICLVLFYFISIKLGYNMGLAFACFPIAFIILNFSFKYPILLFLSLFTANYFVMGINRYTPVQGSIVVDSFFVLLFLSIIVRSTREKLDLTRAKNPLTAICAIWVFFCLLEVINPYTADVSYWYIAVRSMAFYPLFTVVIVALLIRKYKHINWILILWAVFTLLAAAKGYWQKNHGFDATEIKWLYLGEGARTHLISSGIRFFSFFTDAGNYGSSMGFSLVTFSIAAIFVKNKWLKILFLITALAGGYGMIISGTRGALAVPFAGYALFIILSKRWKLAVSGLTILVLAVFILNFTYIGDSNRFVHRMRSAFNRNDASLTVRLENQNTMKKDMQDLPFGAGIGLAKESLPTNSHLTNLAAIPKDSWFVKVWVYTGVVGLTLYIILLSASILWGSYIILFKIKNEQLRGILVGLFSGTFGMMASAYGNEIYTQLPNGILIYTCQALVFIAPYIDKELEKKKETKPIL